MLVSGQGFSVSSFCKVCKTKHQKLDQLFTMSVHVPSIVQPCLPVLPTRCCVQIRYQSLHDWGPRPHILAIDELKKRFLCNPGDCSLEFKDFNRIVISAVTSTSSPDYSIITKSFPVKAQLKLIHINFLVLLLCSPLFLLVLMLMVFSQR